MFKMTVDLTFCQFNVFLYSNQALLVQVNIIKLILSLDDILAFFFFTWFTFVWKMLCFSLWTIKCEDKLLDLCWAYGNSDLIRLKVLRRRNNWLHFLDHILLNSDSHRWQKRSQALARYSRAAVYCHCRSRLLFLSIIISAGSDAVSYTEHCPLKNWNPWADFVLCVEVCHVTRWSFSGPAFLKQRWHRFNVATSVPAFGSEWILHEPRFHTCF